MYCSFDFKENKYLKGQKIKRDKNRSKEEERERNRI